jgi:hypothetical protein
MKHQEMHGLDLTMYAITVKVAHVLGLESQTTREQGVPKIENVYTMICCSHFQSFGTHCSGITCSPRPSTYTVETFNLGNENVKHKWRSIANSGLCRPIGCCVGRGLVCVCYGGNSLRNSTVVSSMPKIA